MVSGIVYILMGLAVVIGHAQFSLLIVGGALTGALTSTGI